jgi:hypothetical protein
MTEVSIRKNRLTRETFMNLFVWENLEIKTQRNRVLVYFCVKFDEVDRHGEKG